MNRIIYHKNWRRIALVAAMQPGITPDFTARNGAVRIVAGQAVVVSSGQTVVGPSGRSDSVSEIPTEHAHPQGFTTAKRQGRLFPRESGAPGREAGTQECLQPDGARGITTSILQQKLLTPNDFPSLSAVAERLAPSESHHDQIAEPFRWRFTRRNLHDCLAKLPQQDRQQSALAA